MLVSGIQQSDSIIHIHVPIFFQILFPFRLLDNIEQSSLRYTVGPCWVSFLNKVVGFFLNKVMKNKNEVIFLFLFSWSSCKIINYI